MGISRAVTDDLAAFRETLQMSGVSFQSTAGQLAVSSQEVARDVELLPPQRQDAPLRQANLEQLPQTTQDEQNVSDGDVARRWQDAEDNQNARSLLGLLDEKFGEEELRDMLLKLDADLASSYPSSPRSPSRSPRRDMGLVTEQLRMDASLELDGDVSQRLEEDAKERRHGRNRSKTMDWLRSIYEQLTGDADDHIVSMQEWQRLWLQDMIDMLMVDPIPALLRRYRRRSGRFIRKTYEAP